MILGNQVELLAPCGSIEALKQAIINGCDACYLAGNHFGARAYANNFSNDELIEAIKLAHLYNVKVYVTVNTLIYDYEFQKAMAYIDFLYNNDVDAVIIQDIGLLKNVRKYYPDLDVHASTQMTIHNKFGAELLAKEGVKRVVLARECSIDEIKQINQEVNIETEIFVHGALCVSYSGQCLMSSMIGGRSGNRGRCAQPCRKLYDLKVNDEIILKNKYLLSPRDLNTIKHLPEIIESGVTSLKIEGRMKSPEYVAIVVSTYRKAIDMYYRSKEITLSNDDLNDLKQIFNRGFTKGFIFGDNGKSFINHDINKNKGVYIGKVTSASSNKVQIKCSKPLHVQDGIYFKKANEGFIITQMLANGKNVTLNIKNNISVGDEVYKTKDYLLEQRVKQGELKKIEINAEIYLKHDQKILLKLVDEKNEINVESDFIVQKSINHKLNKEKVIEQIGKLGNTPFILKDIKVNMDDNIFVTIGALNDIRRKGVEKLIEVRSHIYKRNKRAPYKYESVNTIFNDKVNLSVYCQTLDQVKGALASAIQRIYVSEEIYDKLNEDVKEKVYLARKRINHEDNNRTSKKMLISDIGSLLNIDDNVEVVLNYNLNITNSEAIKYFIEYNIKLITLSPEFNENLYKTLLFENKSILEIIIYGYQELMETKYCIFYDECKGKCQNEMYLVDKKGEKFFLRMDKACHMHIYNSKCLLLSEEVEKLIDIGYRNFRIQLTNESLEDTLKIIEAYKELIFKNNMHLLTSIVTNYKKNNLFTRGYFNKDIL